MTASKVREYILVLALFVTLINGCSSMPIGNTELLPMTSQQVVTGVYGVFSGQIRTAFMFQHSSGLRILLWPGATTGTQTLWNMACLDSCQPGWEHFVVKNGIAMAGKRASEFASYLKNNGWKQIPITTTAVANGASWIAYLSSSLTGFFFVIPASLVPNLPQT